MQSITIKNLTFAYDGQPPLFKNCQLSFNDQWKLGLVGRNGRGKTTLLNILRGQLHYQGSVTTRLHFSYYPLSIANPDCLAINCLQTDLPGIEQWQIEREISELGLDEGLLWQPFATLSGGEQTKLSLAALFATTGTFVLLDEPTNHLDQRGRQQVANYLRKQKTGVMIVSHDRDFLDQIIDHVLAIEKHQLVLEQGNYSTYLKEKQRRDQTAQATNRQLQSAIHQLKETQQRHQAWATKAENQKKHNSHADKGFIGAKAAKMMKKTVMTSQRIDQAISQKRGLFQEVETIVPLSINPLPTHHKTLLELKNVQLSYVKGQPLFSPLSFMVARHQQVAILGDNGAGKSSLFQAIQGHFSGITDGQITFPWDLKISVVRQNYSTNRGTLAAFADRQQIDYNALLNTLRKLGMPRESFNRPIEKLSMGQQKKVELARSLVEPAHLYLWDEPLNYLDTTNQQQLIQLLQENQPPVLFIEHDQHFINQVAQQKITLTS